MGQNYFLSSLIYPRNSDMVSEFSFSEIFTLIQDHFSVADLNKAKILYRFFDLSNWQMLWAGQPLNFSCEYGDEALNEKFSLIEKTQIYSSEEKLQLFFCDFLNAYLTDQDRLKHFSELVKAFIFFYKDTPGFIGEYLQFKSDLRILLASYRAKQKSQRLSEFLHKTEMNDPLTQYLFCHEDNPIFLVPQQYEELAIILNDYYQKPSLLRSQLLSYESRFISDQAKSYFVSSDFVLAHMTLSLIAEQQFTLSSTLEDKITLIEKAIA
ncbi:hypothetical protein CLAVI_000744 [Candidatus Clavichlamydia salmonicola]|uniref:DUF2764 family protein n=1 Tax=Candidatus Clavichlamydia salmonicola TaxID=469812 RepID=UPI0018917422|nr:DUF2764 family protein [Candidatus Clavichlamydia salmonicola]MBF5051110.1 hypothetical protein [Candidatus Clavichlamydia salmonicola]